jgi:hypothetical protein
MVPCVAFFLAWAVAALVSGLGAEERDPLWTAFLAIWGLLLLGDLGRRTAERRQSEVPD